MDGGFISDWSETLSETNKRLQTLLKNEHLRLACESENKFWHEFPDAISLSDEHSLKSWLESIFAILDRDNRNWMKIRHRKLVKQCPNYIIRCKDFTPQNQSTFKANLQYVQEAFHVRHNAENITSARRRRKRDRSVTLSNSENFDRVSDNYFDFSLDFHSNQVESEGVALDNSISNHEEHFDLSSSNVSNGSDPQTQPDERLEGKFVSKNVVNLSKKILTEAEVSVLSKGLKFCPTAKEIDRAKIKEDLEEFGRRLRLKWHYRNEEDEFSFNPFKKKSDFNPKNDVAIEIYLSVIEDQIMGIQENGQNFSNLSKEEQLALKNLQNDKSIFIKSADKGSGVVV